MNPSLQRRTPEERTLYLLDALIQAQVQLHEATERAERAEATTRNAQINLAITQAKLNNARIEIENLQ